MDMLDFFDIDVKGSKVIISCDREMIGDLFTAMETLLRLGKILRMKASTARINEEMQREKTRENEVPIRRERVRREAADVHAIYEKYLLDGCNGDKDAARRATAREIGIRCVDVKILLRMHREFQKAST